MTSGMRDDERYTLNYAGTLDYVAPHALGAAAAPRVNTSILARALAIADDAARCDVETYFVERSRGVYDLADALGQPVRTVAELDDFTREMVAYLVERGLAEVCLDGEGFEYVVLLLDRFRGVEP